ncbi:hypothetical protein FDENT_7428 [Fusarium denticulatum]|uniref:Uncharacterized protein n=1 Tax=Fusarium denticulatum TaxID=48507 RepID=A0A8H5U960_9HYPO|nr:hypothetical protein FDENT_7428 [Fusarium denticulatum]
MEFNIIIVLILFLVGAVFASPLANRNRTEGLSERPNGTDFSRPEPVDRYRNDPRFALGPSLFAAPAIRNSSFVARRIIQKRPDIEEYESKFNHICQSGNKTEHESKLPKPDDNIDVSLDQMEYSEHEKTLTEGKQYAVATPQHLANETNRHEKAQQDREQKLDIIQHELQKEMDAKLQQEHSRMKHENEMKFNASKPERDEQIARL